MSMFKSIFDKLLGKQAPQAPAQSDFLNEWDKKRKARIVEAEGEIKEWLTARVKEKGTLNFSWESGNDEGFVDFEEYNDAEQRQFDTLEMYIIDVLDIPDAGEFQMIGNGTFYLIENTLKVMHSSIFREIVDYDEVTGKEIFGKGNEDKGDVVLFTV